MKKLFCLVLVGLLSISCVAFADTITIDLDTASIEELETAKDAIEARIAELKAVAITPADEIYITRGNGTQILNDFIEPSTISRFVVTADTKFIVTYNKMNIQLTVKSIGCNYADFIDCTDGFSQVMIESQGEWAIDYSPLKRTYSPYMSGNGSYVTDYFAIKTPAIVTFTVEGDYSLCHVSQYSIDENGKVHLVGTPIDQYISGQETFDIIVKSKKDNAQYFFFEINCHDDVKWSIKECFYEQ